MMHCTICEPSNAAPGKATGGPQAARPFHPPRSPGAGSRYLIIAIHGSPITRNVAMKMTPNTAPRIQKSFAGR